MWLLMLPLGAAAAWLYYGIAVRPQLDHRAECFGMSVMDAQVAQIRKHHPTEEIAIFRWSHGSGSVGPTLMGTYQASQRDSVIAAAQALDRSQHRNAGYHVYDLRTTPPSHSITPSV